MNHSDKITQLHSKALKICSANTLCMDEDLLLDLDSGFELHLMCQVDNVVLIVRKAHNPTNEENDDVLIIITAIIAQLLELKKVNEHITPRTVSFREIENMLRDKNSVPSFSSNHLSLVKNIYASLIMNMDHIFSLVSYLKDKRDHEVCLAGLNFFDQINVLNQLHQEFSKLFHIDHKGLPRLNTWKEQSGELSFIVGSQTELGRNETKFFQLFWLEIGEVKTIKMVASEGV
jgi:hypothetical protein